MNKMLKIALLILVAISIPLSAFAEPMIELSTSQTEIQSLDSILVIGKITDVSVFKPVTLTVISPDGEIIYAPELPFDNDGVFKRLIHPPLPSFRDGVYTVIASHEDKIIVAGSTISSTTDITFTVTSPNGNLISIAQVTPGTNGEFSTEIISGGPMWKENGFYTITANQGLSSEHKQSVQVEIDNGVVVPEFGSIAVMILVVAIISIIAVSVKSRLS